GMVQPDATVLEGFVDLIYREDDGSLVIVDYKTDDAPDAALPSRVAYYAPQLNAYRSIVKAATDSPIASGGRAALHGRRSSSTMLLLDFPRIDTRRATSRSRNVLGRASSTQQS